MTAKRNPILSKSEALRLAWKSRKDFCCYRCNVTRSNNFSFDEMKTLGDLIKIIDEKRRNT